MSSLNRYKLVITTPAIEDLESIAAYTLVEWGEEQALKYTEHLYDTFSKIAENPNIGMHRYGVPSTIKGLKSGRHVVFYRIQNDTIFIMRLLHEGMDHGRYLD